jgi:hypothetical protein
MVIWLAVMLAATGLPPENEELPRTLQADDDWVAVDGIVSLRVGGWASSKFSFNAVRTDSLQVSTTQQIFVTTSALAGMQFYEHFVVLGQYEAAFAAKMTVELGGAYLGWREHPKERYGKGVPDEVMAYAGVLVGQLDVHVANFGTFDRGIGFCGGLQFGWTISPHLSVQLNVEYRRLSFNYQVPVATGDTSLGGNSIAFGVGLDIRY